MAALTVSYAKGVPAMSDLAGNEADAFNGLSVSIATTFPAFLSGTVNGTQVTLLYSTYLDPASVPGASQYSIRANGSPVPVTGVSLSGTSVILSLASRLRKVRRLRLPIPRQRSIPSVCLEEMLLGLLPLHKLPIHQEPAMLRSPGDGGASRNREAGHEGCQRQLRRVTCRKSG